MVLRWVILEKALHLFHYSMRIAYKSHTISLAIKSSPQNFDAQTSFKSFHPFYGDIKAAEIFRRYVVTTKLFAVSFERWRDRNLQNEKTHQQARFAIILRKTITVKIWKTPWNDMRKSLTIGEKKNSSSKWLNPDTFTAASSAQLSYEIKDAIRAGERLIAESNLCF